MSIRLLMSVIIAATGLSFATAAPAQNLGTLKVVAQPDLASLAQRIAILEQKNGQLQGEMSQLQQQLADSKAAAGSDFFKDRFRITALEANQKQGGTTTQLGQQLTNLSTRISDVEGKANATDSALGLLTNKFAAHTHSYDRTTFGWENHQLQNVQMAKPTLTSLPNTTVFDPPQH